MNYKINNACLTTDELTAELNAFCEKHSLPQMSADELRAELGWSRGESDVFTPDQIDEFIEWLDDFSERWEAATPSFRAKTLDRFNTTCEARQLQTDGIGRLSTWTMFGSPGDTDVLILEESKETDAVAATVYWMIRNDEIGGAYNATLWDLNADENVEEPVRTIERATAEEIADCIRDWHLRSEAEKAKATEPSFVWLATCEDIFGGYGMRAMGRTRQEASDALFAIYRETSETWNRGEYHLNDEPIQSFGELDEQWGVRVGRYELGKGFFGKPECCDPASEIDLSAEDIVNFYTSLGFTCDADTIPVKAGRFTTMGWSEPQSAADILKPTWPSDLDDPFLPNCEEVN